MSAAPREHRPALPRIAPRVRTRVKICGIRTLDAALHASACGADMIGFVFVAGSPRAIEPAEAEPIMASVPPGVTCVGVIRDRTTDGFYEAVERCPCELWQPHGSETDATLREYGGGLVRGLRFDPSTIDRELDRFAAHDAVGAVLVDGSAGGGGEALDWSGLARALDRTGFGKPVFLAGGLTAANAREAIDAVRPWAVDVSSGVESSPGVKDPRKIESFCRAVREADAARD